MSEDAHAYSKLEIHLEPDKSINVTREHTPVYVLLDLIDAKYNEKIDFKNKLYSRRGWNDTWDYDNDPYVDPTLEALDNAKRILTKALSYGGITTKRRYDSLETTIMFPYEYYDWRMADALSCISAYTEEAGYSRYLYFYASITEGPFYF